MPCRPQPPPATVVAPAALRPPATPPPAGTGYYRCRADSAPVEGPPPANSVQPKELQNRSPTNPSTEAGNLVDPTWLKKLTASNGSDQTAVIEVLFRVVKFLFPKSDRTVNAAAVYTVIATVRSCTKCSNRIRFSSRLVIEREYSLARPDTK